MASQRSMGNFQAPNLGQPKSIGIQEIMPFLSAQAGYQKQGDLRQAAVPNAQDITKQMGGNPPPGSKFDQGGVSIPLNRELTGDERQDVASARSLEPSITSIKSMISKGIFNSPQYGDIGRTTKQALTDLGHPLATSQFPELQDLQSEFNNVKTQLPFTFGGKNLTPTEKDLVFRLLNTTGKSDKIIVNDLDKAMSIIRNKESLVLGGANAAAVQPSPVPGMGNAGQKSGAEQSSRIKVRNLADNRTGTISASSFDDKKYARI